MSLQSISAQEAQELVGRGGVLIDVREAGEYAHERIPGSKSHPLSALPTSIPASKKKPAIFLCHSGARTRVYGTQLANLAHKGQAYELRGGLVAWKRAGLPLDRDPNARPPLMGRIRLVMMIAFAVACLAYLFLR